MTGSDHSERIQPAKTEPAAQSFIEFLGGAMGKHAVIGSARWLTPLRVIYIVCATFLVFAYMAKARCIQSVQGDNGWTLTWAGTRQYVSACYNDIVPLYRTEGLADGHFPYFYSWVSNGQVRYMEYPVLTGLYQWVIATISRNTYSWLPLPFAEVTWYFALTALSLSIFWFLCVRYVYILSGNRVWDVILMVASPLVIIHAFSNWDIFSIFFALAALHAVHNKKHIRAGIYIGLGTAAKLWPLFLLGALLVVALRDPKKKMPSFLYTLGSAAAAWLIVNLPIMILSPTGWREFLRLNSERSWEWTTIYAVLNRLFGLKIPVDTLNIISFVFFALLCVFVLWLGLKFPQFTVVQLFFFITAFFLLSNKVWSPQYSIWLIPLAVLSIPRWRLLWVWMFAEAILWPILTWHMMGTDKKGIPGEMLNIFILIRDALLITVLIQCARSVIEPTGRWFPKKKEAEKVENMEQ